MRLPTSWERVVPSARPTPVTSCPPHSCRGRPYPGCLVPSSSAAAKAIWLSALGHGGVWTHSSATNRRESRGQPKDRNSQGGPYAAGPDVGEACLSAAAGGAVRKLDVAFLLVGPLRVAGARCHLWSTERSTDGGRRPCGQGIRLSRRVSPCLCSSNAAHTRDGKGRFDARPRNCKSVPVRGSDGPDQPAVVSATATRRHVPPRSRSERTSRRAVGGRRASGAADNWFEPCAPLFTVAPLDLTYPGRCSESWQVERPRARQWSSRGSAGAPARTVLR